jgi:hypothetical protein
VSATSAVPSRADAPDGLDWQTFTANYFPGRRRHDFEALTAYGDYKRPRPLDEVSSPGADKAQGARNGGTESRALQTWEDEGGQGAAGEGLRSDCPESATAAANRS